MCKTKFAPVGLLCLFMALFFAVPQLAVAQTVIGTYGGSYNENGDFTIDDQKCTGPDAGVISNINGTSSSITFDIDSTTTSGEYKGIFSFSSTFDAAGTITFDLAISENSGTSCDSKSFSFTVDKATLTVKANDANITFGDPDPTSSYGNNNATITGFKLTDTESNTSIGTLTFSTTYNKSTNGDVGNSYTITPAGGTSSNYDFSYVDGTLTVNPKGITEPALTTNELTYNGNPQTVTLNPAAPAGEYDFASGQTETNAGNSYSAVVALSSSTNYKWSGSGNSNNLSLPWKILKADPSCSPSNLTATEGQTLSQVSLASLNTCGGVAGTFAWDNSGTSVGTAATSPNGPFPATFTPSGADANNYNTAAVQISINVSAAVPGTGTITFTPTPGTYGVAYNGNVTATTGFTGSTFDWSVSDGDLPDGLDLDETATGSTTTISGTPAKAGSFTFKIKAVDNNNIEGEQQFSITIAKATPVCVTSDLSGISATEGQTLSQVSLASLTTCGGVAGTFAWDNSGTSVGSAGQNPFPATFTPTDGANYNTAAAQISINVAPKITISTATITGVTTPANGASDASSPTTTDPGYSITTPGTWTPSLSGNPFGPNIEYEYELVLTPKPGYEFAASSTTAEINNIIATWTPDGANVKLKVKFPITLTKTLSTIAVTSDPTIMAYTHNEPLNKLSGLQVTLTYDDNSTDVLTDVQFQALGGKVRVVGGTSEAPTALVSINDNGKNIEVEYSGKKAITTKTLTVTEIEIITAAVVKITPPKVTGSPAATATPVGTVDFTTGAVTWTPSVATGSTFLPGTVYTAKVTLTPNEGYKFGSAFTATIDSAATTVAAGTVTGTKELSGVFPATADAPITTVNLTFDAPATGASPNTAPLTGVTPQFTVDSVKWTPNHDPFQSNTAYTVTAYLKAASGYTFTGVAAKINNNNVTPALSNNGKNVSLPYAFPATPAKTVNDIAVDRPPAKMVYDFNESLRLDSLIVLLNYDDNTTDTVKAGYAGKGITIALANGNKGNPLKMEDNGQAIEVMYIKGTDTTKTSAGSITVNKIKIKNAIVTVVEPANGGIPNMVANAGPAFTASSVFWSPTDNPYKPLTRYTAKVSLAVNEGYELVLPLDTATINDSTAAVANNPDGTITLSYEFPETLATPSLVVTKVAIKTQPINMVYTHGDQLDLSGLEVTFTYSDNRTEDIKLSSFASKRITTNPINGALLTSSAHNNARVEVTYTYNKTNLRAYTDNLIVLKKVVPTIVIAGKTVAVDSTDGKKFTFVSKCGETSVNIDISQEDAEIVVNGGTIGINQNVINTSLDYGDNPFNIAVTPDVGAREVYTLTVKKPFPADSLIQISWGNTLTVIDNTRYNPYKFTNYKWYRNDREVGSGRSWSTGTGEKLNPRDKYFVEAITEDGKSIRSCEVAFTAATLQGYGILLKNNPANSNIGIDVSAPEETSEMEIAVYNITGKLVFTQKGNYNFNWNLTDAMHRNVSNGMYIVTAKAKGESGNIYRYSAKFVVKR